jgi:membrane associated rhomboid family serine protease
VFPIGDQNEPGRGLPFVTLAIIGLNVAIFLLLQQAGGNNDFTYGWSAIPREIVHGVDLVRAQVVVMGGQQFQVPQAPGPDPIQLTLLSSMFMHAGWLHLGGNMLFLWVFGDNVEHRAGPIPYLLIYLAVGVIGSLTQILSDPTSPIPTLGASGAISGILGAYIVLFPTNRVTVFMFRFLTQVPAIVAIGIWIVFQLISGFGASVVSDESGGGVAYLAHIGGFAAGALVGLVLRTFVPPSRGKLQGAW